MTTKTIAGVIPGVMAVGLLAHNVKELDFGLDPKKGKKKKDAGKKMVKLGVTNLVLVPMIGAVGGMVNKL